MRGKRTLRRVGAALVALALVGAAVGGAVTFDRQTGANIAPVEDAEALGATASLVGGIVIGSVACDTVLSGVCGDGGAKASELRKADALETKTEIYKSLSGKSESNQVYQDTLGNYLEDTETVALIEGKNAYIRSLNNESSQAIAEAEATGAVADYYSQRQIQLINAWNTTITSIISAKKVSQNTTGVPTRFVYVQNETKSAGSQTIETGPGKSFGNGLFTEESITLANGSSRITKSIDIRVEKFYSGGSSDKNRTIDPSEGGEQFSHDGVTGEVRHIYVHPPNSNYDRLTVLDFDKFANKWSEIEQQQTAVSNNISSFTQATYDQYQAGEINNSQLIDPYLSAREFAPEAEFETWALRTYASIGIQPPDGLTNISTMNITAGSVQYDGLLLNGGEGTIEEGTTYDASNLSGKQFIMDSDGQIVKELQGTFTVESIGGQSSVNYSNPTYNTTDTSEYQTLLQRLETLQAELNARQQQARNSGGGGLIGGIGLGGGVGTIAAIGAALYLLGRTES